MFSLDHPFIVKLFATFKSPRYLYFMMEYVTKGDLYFYLKKEQRFKEEVAKKIVAGLVLAIEYLHSQNIIYRDLKPENILVDQKGHIKLTDFGFSKKINSQTMSIVGTLDYMAPEIILGKGHGKAVDYWSLGILIFELITGKLPFSNRNNDKKANNNINGTVNNNNSFHRVVDFNTFINNSSSNNKTTTTTTTNNNIDTTTITTTTNTTSKTTKVCLFSQDLQDLVLKLLEFEADNRIGIHEIKNHKWFSDINWLDFESKIEPGPFLNLQTFKNPQKSFVYNDDFSDSFSSYHNLLQNSCSNMNNNNNNNNNNNINDNFMNSMTTYNSSSDDSADSSESNQNHQHQQSIKNQININTGSINLDFDGFEHVNSK